MTHFIKFVIVLFLISTFSCSQNTSNKENLTIKKDETVSILQEKTDQQQAIETICSKMQEQENCWNSGNLECFMQHYWHSDSLLFIGKSGLTYGWQPTLNNYIESYPDKSAMGKLTFTNELKSFIDKETVQVIGQWELQRDSLDNLGGYYSLIWKIKEGEWVIISDHSS